ncbi:MAG: bifunctional oligoribonuclease/PAP phosphatase NrnA [Deltaproteobacteria bacterium]|nr:bifunctional oligoribonuclease/PAP phosphatase NrnA [Deltaproteobacteria bacterium]
MFSEVAKILRNEDGFVVATHVNPDGDALGSLFGLALALTDMGKNAYPVLAEEIPETYHFLPGLERVVTDPRSINPAPAWVICVDAAEQHRVSGDLPSFVGGARVINIDHHPTNPLYGDVNLVDPSATSTAEMIHEALKQAGYRLTPDVGMCLYTGLITDTGGFRFSGVNSRTLSMGSEMLASGFDSYQVTLSLFEDFPLGRLRLERIMLERIEVLLDDQVIISVLYNDDFSKLSLAHSDAENLVSRLREVRGVEVGVLITEQTDGFTRVSLRSKNLVDVARLAKSLGGGGHRRAAGLRTDLPPSQIKKKIEELLREAIYGKTSNPAS